MGHVGCRDLPSSLVRAPSRSHHRMLAIRSSVAPLSALARTGFAVRMLASAARAPRPKCNKKCGNLKGKGDSPCARDRKGAEARAAPA